MALEQGSTGVNSGVSGTGPTRLPDAVADVAQAPVAEFPEILAGKTDEGASGAEAQEPAIPEVPSVTRVPAEEIGAEANGTEAQATPGPDVVAATSGTLESGDFSTQGATDAEAGEEKERTWKDRMGCIAKIAAAAAVAFGLIKRFFKNKNVDNAPTAPSSPQPSGASRTETKPHPEDPQKEKEAEVMSELLNKFATRVTDTLSTYATCEEGENKHFWERWLTVWGTKLFKATDTDNAYREEHGMNTLDAKTRVGRMFAILVATVSAMAADILIPMATGDAISDPVIAKFRNEIYEGLSGDKLGSTATKIAEFVTSFIPGVTSLNLVISGLYELATLSSQGGKVERRLGNSGMGKIMDFMGVIFDRKKTKNAATATA